MPRIDTSVDWKTFCHEHGWRVPAEHLAAVLGVDPEQVRRHRGYRSPRPRQGVMSFPELFTVRHGRPPTESDWPRPRKTREGTYALELPELELLGRLVGTMSFKQIASVLTTRLRKITGDKAAGRTTNAVMLAANRMGLQSTDVLGGLTVSQAGQEIGSTHIVNAAIQARRIKARKVGRLWVIPYAEWERWKTTIVRPPEGHVPLASIRLELGFSSDSKLPEFATLGYIPSAVRCNPYGMSVRNTAHGTWYVKASIARRLVADRKAGRPMPWHGKPLRVNLERTYQLWCERQHPRQCATCREIWGQKGPPKCFDEYAARYPALQHGAKRHLTVPWNPGLTTTELAYETGNSVSLVVRAIRNQVLVATKIGRCHFISRTHATRWKARGCPSGDTQRSYIPLARAMKEYGFTPAEIKNEIRTGRIKGKLETAGPMKGEAYVLRQHCAIYRERVGFTEAHAAARVGVSVPKLRQLLKGIEWRMGDGEQVRIPLRTVESLIKRNQSSHGYSIDDAAKKVDRSAAWVRQQIADGVIRVSRPKWDRRKMYISEPMVKRLVKAARSAATRVNSLSDDWLTLEPAAIEAGVTTSTILKWANEGTLKRRMDRHLWRYHRSAVRSRARVYWNTRVSRRGRRRPPQWLAGPEIED